MAKFKSFKRRFKQIDLFPTLFHAKFPSSLGACTSIFVWIILALYGINKYLIMSRYDDTIFNEYAVRNELSDNEFS